MSMKRTFSLSDVAVISNKMSHKSGYSFTSTALSRAPSSPVAAKVMREVGVSREKMQEAYSFANSVVAKK